MHELSVAHSLVRTVEQALEGHQGSLREVRVRVGALSGVVPEALVFAFDVTTAGTPLAGAVLVVELVPVTVYCPDCRATCEVAGVLMLACPHCGRPTGDVRTGRELAVASLLLDDPVGVDETHGAAPEPAAAGHPHGQLAAASGGGR